MYDSAFRRPLFMCMVGNFETSIAGVPSNRNIHELALRRLPPYLGMLGASAFAMGVVSDASSSTTKTVSLRLTGPVE